MAKIEIRLPYVQYENPPMTDFEPTLTQQISDECDYNKILERYERTQILEHVNPSSPQFLDVSEVADYQTALQIVQEAQDAFMALPARTRSRFDNDPQRYVDFCLDPANRDEAIALGLVEPAPVPSTSETAVSDDPKPA